ncbi:MAG: PQQ-binding-like beta-propeller repeat protein [Planctomycetota bacterium]
MLRHVARTRTRKAIDSRSACIAGSLLAAMTALSSFGLELVGPPKPEPVKPAAAVDKPKGPEHNVSLMEEPGVNDLFNKAAKARARAEKEPEAWPECVKCYADILKKYPHTVYLDKWEGPDKEHPVTAYKNGLYKSTRERVAAEIASLPPAALTVYRVVNESAARTLYIEGQDTFDERKMDQVARNYFQTTWSNDALAWLGEASYERGATREAAERLKKAVANPGKNATPMSVLARLLLAQIRSADKAGAAKTVTSIEDAMKDPAKGALRIGNDAGPAALAKLKSRIDAIATSNTTAETADSNGDWPTYFGNAAHTQPAQSRESRGLRKWSIRISDLLYGKSAGPADNDKVALEDGNIVQDGSINQQLTVKDGDFYLNNGQVYAAFSVGDPGFSSLNPAGKEKYRLPLENVKPPPPSTNKNNRNINNGMFVAQNAIIQHPYFTTLGGDRAYGILGAESFAQSPNFNRGFRMMRGGGNSDEKALGPSNYPICIGRATADGKPSILWDLKPGSAAFKSQSKPDQDFLKGAYFVSTPTFDSGVLYCAALIIPPNADGAAAPLDSWAVAIDADNGQLLWRTQICTATPIRFGGGGTADVQPDRGLPVAVANRTVYVVTNLGAVAALDAGGGTVKWIRVYDRTKTTADQMFGVGEVAATRDFWAPNPPIVHKNRLIVTPQDSDLIYGYDLDTGARAWEKSRLGDQDIAGPNGGAGMPQGGYKHVLGIANGALVLTGKNIIFVNALNGKTLADPLAVEGTIKGRGAVTDKAAWISTDKELLRIDITNETGKFKFGEPKAFKWTEPKIEAGSVYAAGGALYTVSHSHVNAYVIWEELEAKLREQLAAKPDAFAPRLELADIYKSIGRFEQAIEELDKALPFAPKPGADGKPSDVVTSIGTRKFEAFMGIGEKAVTASKPADAIEPFQKAYTESTAPGIAELLPVIALKAQAEAYQAAGNLAAAATAYQRILAKHGNAVLVDAQRASKMARLFAQMRLAELKAKDPTSLAAIDAEAKTAFAGVGTDLAKLEQVIALYPNSDFAATALLTVARLELEKAPDRARLAATRYLSRQRDGAGAAQALAILAVAYEQLDLLAASRTALVRLATNDSFKDIKAPLYGIAPKAVVGDVSLREWAVKRLEDPRYQRPLSQSVFSIGKAPLNNASISQVLIWSKPNAEGVIPLIPDGIPPVDMRRAVFTLEAQNELSAIDGRDGLELWKPRPTAPQNSRGRAFWWERYLIVCGESSIVAFDSAENGKVVWTQDMKSERNGETGYWAQIGGDRLIVAHSGNALKVFDAASGALRWEKKLPASQLAFPPVLGDGFVVVATANSNSLTAYNLETESTLWTAEIAELRTPPVLSGDLLFAAQRNQKLSVIDCKTGKRACPDITLESQPVQMRAAGELAIISMENRSLAAFRCSAQNPGKAWPVLLPTGSSIIEFAVDGDDLLVTSSVSQTKHEVTAYSIKSEGKIRWKQDMAADAANQANQIQRPNGRIINNMGGGQIRIIGQGRVVINGQAFANGNVIDEGNANFTYMPDGSGGWLRENVSRDTLAVLQSVWDQSGAQSKRVSLIDRATGKSIWDSPLKCEVSALDNSLSVPRIQFFEGGLVVSESQSRSGFSAARSVGTDDVKNFAAVAAKDPADTDARMKLATAHFDKGDREKGLDELAVILKDPKLSDADFSTVYTHFAALRKVAAAEKHATVSFQRVDKAPDIAGGSSGWENVSETVFDGWKHVVLASEDAAAQIKPTKELWRGSDDLKATFKGAYDETNLYIQITVKDDQHKNELMGSNIDFSDSVRLAFDIDLARGMGYKGKAFELSLGLGKESKAYGWRRLENARYLRGLNPLEKDFSVTRKEVEKTTLYQIALPLNYLGLKAEPGKAFGFTFAVQDHDAGTGIDKSICPSAGLIGTREPRLFSQGVLEAKK